MKNQPAEVYPAAETGETPLLEELFHGLSQPLTSLQCSLELSLQRPRSEEEYRQTLRRALEQAGEIARLTCGIRDLLQAGDPGEQRQVLSVGTFLREAVSDLQPVAESLQVQLRLHGDLDGSVFIEPQRLRQALFSLIEYALPGSGAGQMAAIQAGEEAGEAVVRLTSSGKLAAEAKSAHLGLAIAGRIVEAAGGTLHFHHDYDQEKFGVELRLPLVSVPV